MTHKLTKEEWEKTVAWVGVVAGCLLQKDGKFLLVQEKQQKVYGLWNLPAGHVDINETIQSAAKREVLEETGYIVELGDEIAIFHESATKPVKHIYRADIIGGELQIQEDEILDAKWLSRDEVEALRDGSKLRADWVWEVVERAT